ncbi:MAG: hypothetical protein Ta2E_05460 [Mycoplasmoidaceae bacterium]|nr:MAG: hypothetical protein Ta2E_05460 [Mycoplasmoidaceae bacterium]
MAKQKYYNLPHGKSPLPIIIGLLCVGAAITAVTVPVILLKPKPDNTQKIVINSGMTKYDKEVASVNQIYTWKAKNSKPEFEIDDAVWSTQGALPPYLSFDAATATMTGTLKLGSKGNFDITVRSEKQNIQDTIHVVVDVPVPNDFHMIAGTTWQGLNNTYVGRIASDYNTLTIPRTITRMGISDQNGASPSGDVIKNLTIYPEIRKINFETNSELSYVCRGLGANNQLQNIYDIDFSNTYKHITMSAGSLTPDNNFFNAYFSRFTVPGNFLGIGRDPFRGCSTLSSLTFDAGDTIWPNNPTYNSGDMWGEDGFDTGCMTFTVNREFEYFGNRFLHSQNSLTDVYLNIPVPAGGFDNHWMTNMSNLSTLRFHFLPAYYADWVAAFGNALWEYNTGDGTFNAANLLGDSVIS